MLQQITGYHLDFENHWVAELECGHSQHVRHDPPWSLREWVTTAEGRSTHLGSDLNCIRCNETGIAVARALLSEVIKSITQKYEEAGISGLCNEGRIEVALGALNSLPLMQIVEDALISKRKFPPT